MADKDGRLAEKVAVVTGGASGIGEETARLFARNGAKVCLADLNEERGLKVVDDINNAGGEAMFTRLDVRDAQAWQDIVERILDSWQRLDILVNAAGIAGGTASSRPGGRAIAGARLEDLPDGTWDDVMDVNAKGTFLGCRNAIPAMRRGGTGSIVNISSICGLVGSHGNSAYHASKGAVRLLTKSAAVQYGADQIRVNTIFPGFVRTPLTEAAYADAALVARRLESVPLGRIGSGRDVANGCLFLASDEAAWITGAELAIDGGLSAV